MKEIQLTKGFVTQVDDEDFDYLNQWEWSVCKNHNTYYAVRSVPRSNKQPGQSRQISIKMHRVILNITDSKTLIDHIDHNGLNNQRSNLRGASHTDNIRNCSPFKNAISKYKGVSPSRRKKNPWKARIFYKQTRITIGSFKTEKEAALAYNKKALELYGEFAYLNTIVPEHSDTIELPEQDPS